jgi:antitoxin HigA-1
MKFKRFVNPAHPGEILLEEFLKPMEMSQIQFSKKIGWSSRKVNEIIKGKRGITAASALGLADYFKSSPEFWLNLQQTWDLAEAFKEREAS